MGKIRSLLRMPFRIDSKAKSMKPDFSEIITYIKASIIKVRPGRKCVDGRYLPDQGTGMIARPGADCGYVMALDAINIKKKLGLSPEACFNIVYKAIIKSGDRFGMHTDDHTKGKNGSIGCGHLSTACNKRKARKYDVKSVDMQHIISYACNISEISQGIDMVELHGGHQEQGVLIIHSDKYTVLADNPKLHKMFFIYDELRDRAFLKELVNTINMPAITFEDMKYELDMQLYATLRNLALGLPIYDITFRDDKPVVTFSGYVTQESLRSRIGRRLPLQKLPVRFAKAFSK